MKARLVRVLVPKKTCIGYIIRYYNPTMGPVGYSFYIHLPEEPSCLPAAMHNIGHATVFDSSREAFDTIRAIKTPIQNKYRHKMSNGHFYVSKAWCEHYQEEHRGQFKVARKLTKEDRYDFLRKL